MCVILFTVNYRIFANGGVSIRFNGKDDNVVLELYIWLHAVIFPLTVMLVNTMFTCIVLICVCRQISLWLMLSCCKFESRL